MSVPQEWKGWASRPPYSVLGLSGILLVCYAKLLHRVLHGRPLRACGPAREEVVA